MVYAGVMFRRFHALMLLLALLVQGYGNAWALMPMAPPVTAPAVEQAPQQTSMPCHEAMQQAESKREMPCCGEDCRCAQGCFSSAALMPDTGPLDEYLVMHFQALSAQPDLLPAHPRLLLRPPSASRS